MTNGKEAADSSGDCAVASGTFWPQIRFRTRRPADI